MELNWGSKVLEMVVFKKGCLLLCGIKEIMMLTIVKLGGQREARVAHFWCVNHLGMLLWTFEMELWGSCVGQEVT